MEFDFVFSLAVLVMSVVVHEVAHGYAALLLGDRTADLAGRLTLNPLKHLDLWGSIIFPSISYFLGGFIFGWAKPVPVNVYNLKNQRWGEFIVASAGPVSNLFLAIVFGLFLRYLNPTEPSPLVSILITVVLTNLVLAIFNLMPIPPLDGSKVLAGILPYKYQGFVQNLERLGFVFVLVFALVLWRFVTPFVDWLFVLITGLY